MALWFPLIILINLFLHIRSAKILVVVPTPSISHQVIFRPITQELARRGHEVVVITTDPAFSKHKTPRNLTEIDVHGPSYEVWKETLGEVMHSKDNFSKVKSLYKGVAKAFEAQIKLKEVKDIIDKKSGEFDLILTEACARPALSFSHVFKVPLIQISSFGAVAFNDEYVGAYAHPLFFPIPWHEKTYNLTNWEKLYKLWEYWDFKNYFNNLEEEENKILKAEFGADIPELNVLKNNIALLILNVYPFWVDNQPVPSSLVYVGGIQNNVRPMKNIPEVCYNLLLDCFLGFKDHTN